MKKRILSVDVLRGMTMFMMIIANVPGGSKVFAPLDHAVWNGITLVDFVFPFFLTIMGISTYFSLSKYNFKPCKECIFRIIRRFVLIMLLAYASKMLNAIISGAFNGKAIMDALAFDTFRLPGVLQRIALCYLLASLIILFIKNKKLLIGIIAVLLLGYTVVLLAGNGLVLSEDNIIAKVDISVFTTSHMYSKAIEGGTKIAFDPEGLLSSIFATSQVLIGFFSGGIIKDKSKELNEKITTLFVMGFSLLLAGYVYSFFIPLNKSIWSPSFILFTAGACITLLALLSWIIDYKGHTKWCKFFEIYGLNAIFIFFLYGPVLYLVSGIGVKKFIYDTALAISGCPELASLVYSVLFALLMWLFNFVLYKKKITIRL